MSAAPAARPAAHPPLRGFELVLGTLAVSLATFMNVLDTSIANVSIPAIAGDLGVSPSQATWVITSFGVSNAIALPLTGWLTQRIGAVRLFVGSVLTFVLASWLCGLAPTLELLVVFRVLQGASAGPLMPLAQTLLLASYPPRLAGMALAMWSMTTMVAPIAGPVLGGWITDNFSWPWIFYINVPVGLVAAAVTLAIYRRRDTPTRRVPVDAVGLGLLVLWVGALQILLDKGQEADWFASGEILALALVAGIGFAIFLVWELTDRHPVVDLSLFRSRNFAVGAISVALGYGLYFGNVVLLPLWLQQHMGYTATFAGVALAAGGVLAIVLMPFVGNLVVRRDCRPLASLALASFAFVFWMRSWFSTDADLATILMPSLLQGIGMAFFFLPLMSLSFAGLPPEKLAAASGMSNFLRISAGSFGTSITTTLWDERATMHHAHMAEAIHPGSPAATHTLDTLRSLGAGGDQSLAVVTRAIDQQAFTMAANDIYLVSSLLYLGLIVLVWQARSNVGRGLGHAAPADAH